MIVDDNIFPKLLFGEVSPPATPAAGTVILYAKADGLIYAKDDAGVEKLLSTGLFTGGALSSALNEAKGADIASAATTDIGAAAGNFVHVTGTTAITALGTIQAGTRRIVRFAGALVLTHNATSLILPTAANITTAANDCAIFISEGGGNWRCVGYMRADGSSLAGGGGGAVSSVNGATGAVVLDDGDVKSVVTALTSGTTVTVDCSLGRNFTLTLGHNVGTLTLSNLAGSGYATEIEIEIKQDGTGGRTFALPASFKALGGSDTAIASAANAVTVLSAKTFDNGTTWRYAMQESA